MDYKELAKDAKVMAKSFRQDGNVYLPNRLEMHATAITDLLARAEAAEAAQETLQRAMAEYKARAEKAERELNRLLEEEEKVPFDPFWMMKEK